MYCVCTKFISIYVADFPLCGFSLCKNELTKNMIKQKQTFCVWISLDKYKLWQTMWIHKNKRNWINNVQPLTMTNGWICHISFIFIYFCSCAMTIKMNCSRNYLIMVYDLPYDSELNGIVMWFVFLGFYIFFSHIHRGNCIIKWNYAKNRMGFIEYKRSLGTTQFWHAVGIVLVDIFDGKQKAQTRR